MFSDDIAERPSNVVWCFSRLCGLRLFLVDAARCTIAALFVADAGADDGNLRGFINLVDARPVDPTGGGDSV
jgi:hypothetical protein